MLTPRRRRGVEILDDPSVDPAVRERAIDDVTRSNRILGGLRAALAEVRAVRGDTRDPLVLLDVGSGLADIPRGAADDAARDGVRLTTIALDGAASLASAALRRVDAAVCADALSLPFGDASVDVVVCSQLLHHFEETDAVRVLAELDRVARIAVVVSDLRRSWFAAGGFWAVSFPLRFHPITRHDGVVSVLRGFTSKELAALVHRATGAHAVVRRRLGFRLTARWSPIHGSRAA